MKTDTKFIDLMRQTTYFTIYCSLMEMRAGADILKAFEEYQKADLQGIQMAGAWVREWQQAKIAEAMKEAYLMGEDSRKHQEELFTIGMSDKKKPS